MNHERSSTYPASASPGDRLAPPLLPGYGQGRGLGEACASHDSRPAFRALPARLGVWVLCFLIMAACNRLDRDAPVPIDPSGPDRIGLTTDEQGRALIDLAALGINRTIDFTLTSLGFSHGTVGVAEGNVVYRARTATGWAADSGTMTVCQQGTCRNRRLVILNFHRTDPQPLSCIVLPGLTRFVTLAGQSLSTELPGLDEPGARIDSLWGYLASAQVNVDGTGFTYAPTGPDVFSNVAASDEVFYRVRRQGQQGCYLSSVRFYYPDSCTYMLARQDIITPTSLPDILSPAFLLANDRNCAQAPTTHGQIRLTPESYTGSRKVLSRQGAISLTDTTINGNQQFYVRQLMAGPTQDTLSYYLVDTLELRISRALIIVRLP